MYIEPWNNCDINTSSTRHVIGQIEELSCRCAFIRDDDDAVEHDGENVTQLKRKHEAWN